MTEYIVCPYCHNPLSQSEYVKVVRCRDCEHYEVSELGQGFCIWKNYTDWECEPDGYCKWGERK